MVAIPARSTPAELELSPAPVVNPEVTPVYRPGQAVSLADFLAHPPDQCEWVNGLIVKKTVVTSIHSASQVRLARILDVFVSQSGLGGVVYVELLCRTQKQGRRPDVSYITPELLTEVGRNYGALPQSFPLIAEIASPDDPGEGLLAKAKEYLESGAQEVWIIFPENEIALTAIMAAETVDWQIFNRTNPIVTRAILPGLVVNLAELFQ